VAIFKRVHVIAALKTAPHRVSSTLLAHLYSVEKNFCGHARKAASRG
jgi:hypothetical protein